MEARQMLGRKGSLLAIAAALLATCGAACTQATAGAASKLVSGHEEFQSVVTSVSSFNKGGTSSLIATGVIGGGGVAVTVADSATWTAIVKLPGGSFRLFESGGSGTHHLDKATCIFTQHTNGIFKVSHGTGKYAGISGRGTYHYDWLMAAPHGPSGSCPFNVPPVAIQQITKFSGKVSY
jgi:hypothetical protein